MMDITYHKLTLKELLNNKEMSIPPHQGEKIKEGVEVTGQVIGLVIKDLIGCNTECQAITQTMR